MDIQLRKLKVMEMLMKVQSEKLMERMEKLLEKEMIVGYTSSGKPLTIAAYNKRIEVAEAQIAQGKVTSQEDLEKEMEQW